MAHELNHGYRIVTDSLTEFNDIVERFRAEATTLSRQMIARWMTEKVMEKVDRAVVQGKPAPETPLAAVNRKCQDVHAESKAKGTRALVRGFDDFDVEANFMPHDGIVYVLLHAYQPEYHDLFRAMPGVEEYPCILYQSDPSWGIRKAEWKRRQEAWTKVLNGQRLGPKGLQFELIGNYLPQISADELMEQMPPFEERVRARSYEALCDEWFQNNKPPKMDAGEELDMSDFSRAYSEFQEWVKTPEGQNALADKADQVRAMLNPEPTEETLYGFVPTEKNRGVRPK